VVTVSTLGALARTLKQGSIQGKVIAVFKNVFKDYGLAPINGASDIQK
jgi:hypothetical protein